MGIAERRAREREELRTRILEAASQLIVSEGYQQVSIRKIADQIEYSPSTIYLYFKDKMELVAAIVDNLFEELSAALHEIEKTANSPLDGLRAGLRRYIDFGIAHPEHYQVAFQIPIPEAAGVNCSMSASEERAYQTGQQAFDYLRRAVRRCVDSGAIPACDVEALSQAMWACLHGVTSLMVSMYGHPGFPWVDKELLIETTLDLLMSATQIGKLPELTPVPATA